MPNFNTQSGVVYIKEAGTLGAYKWAGRFAQLAEIVTPYGDVSPTQAFDPRGGIYVDGTLVAEPGVPTSTLTIKAQHYSKARSYFAGTKLNIDRRMHINGIDRDNPYGWVDIERLVGAVATTRTTPKTVSAAQEEALIEIPVTGQFTTDIYRVVLAEYSLANLDAEIVAACVSNPISFYNKIASMYAVANISTTVINLTLLYNNDNGNNSQWVVKELMGITDLPVDIIGFGNFVGILTDAGTLVRSDTYGDDISVVTPAVWGSNLMSAMFGLDQTLLFAVGTNGYISKSLDGGRTWTTSSEANALGSDSFSGGGVFTNRSLFAYGKGGLVAVTQDAGESWYTIPLSYNGAAFTDNILAMSMFSKDSFIIVASDGFIYSCDDGETLIQQTQLEGLPAGTYLNARIDVNKSDVGHLFISDDTTSYFYRSVDGGANGYWYKVKEGDLASGTIVHDMAVLGDNLTVLVGETSNAEGNAFATVK